MTILIIGATGLVGRELVRLAAERSDVSQVTALVRRDPGARTTPDPVRYGQIEVEIPLAVVHRGGPSVELLDNVTLRTGTA